MEFNEPIYLVSSLEDEDTINYKTITASASDCEILIGRQGEIVDRDTDDGILFMCWGTNPERLIQEMKNYKIQLIIYEEDCLQVRKQTIQNTRPIYLEN